MKYVKLLLIFILVIGLVFTGCGKDSDVLDEEVDEVPLEEDLEENLEDDAVLTDADDLEENLVEDIEEEQEEVLEDVEVSDSEDEVDEDVEEDEEVSLDSDEPFMVEITQGVYFSPDPIYVKAGQEVVFVNKPVDGKKDSYWTLVGDSKDSFASEVMGPYDQYSHVYSEPGIYTLKISPGGAGKIIVE